MEDFIILILFLLASLASYISKHRELKKRKKQRETFGEAIEELDWPPPAIEPKTEPAETEIGFPLSPLKPDSSAETEIGFPPTSKLDSSDEILIEEKAASIPPAPLSVHSSIPLDSDTSMIPATEALLTTHGQKEKDLIPAEVLHNQARIYGSNKIDIFTRVGRSKIDPVSVDLMSKISLKKAFLVREILDRPRAYDT